jgi:hypothetical protein
LSTPLIAKPGVRHQLGFVHRDIGFWDGIYRVLGGAGQLRLIIQPLVAIFLGARLGVADARTGKEPFLLRLVLTKRRHEKIAKLALFDAIVPFCIAIVFDTILQYYTLHTVRPVAALVVGTFLVWLPFAISRALTNRIVRRAHRDHPEPLVR